MLAELCFVFGEDVFLILMIIRIHCHDGMAGNILNNFTFINSCDLNTPVRKSLLLFPFDR